MKQTPRQLLLVEDNPLFAEQIVEAITSLSDPWQVHASEEGQAALEIAARVSAPFDMALIDLGLPDMSGVEVIRFCRQRFPEMPIVVISVISSEAAVLEAIEAGASGYILKDESIEEITAGMRRVLDGIYPLSPPLARYLFKRLSGKSEPTADDSNSFNLTPRELETLRHLAKGNSYEAVADLMGVALSTIQWNVRNLYRKLNVRSQVQAIYKARDHQLL